MGTECSLSLHFSHARAHFLRTPGNGCAFSGVDRQRDTLRDAGTNRSPVQVPGRCDGRVGERAAHGRPSAWLSVRNPLCSAITLECLHSQPQRVVANSDKSSAIPIRGIYLCPESCVHFSIWHQEPIVTLISHLGLHRYVVLVRRDDTARKIVHYSIAAMSVLLCIRYAPNQVNAVASAIADLPVGAAARAAAATLGSSIAALGL
jgi:hypothetical protein